MEERTGILLAHVQEAKYRLESVPALPGHSVLGSKRDGLFSSKDFGDTAFKESFS